MTSEMEHLDPTEDITGPNLSTQVTQAIISNSPMKNPGIEVRIPGPSNPTPRTRKRISNYKNKISRLKSRLFRARSKLDMSNFRSSKKTNDEKLVEIEDIIKRSSKYLEKDTLDSVCHAIKSKQAEYVCSSMAS